MVRLIANSMRRLALKIASYGVMHLVVAIAVAFAITRDWRLALAVGVVEPAFQTVAYSLHDRIWHAIERRSQRSAVEETAEAVSPRFDRKCRRMREGVGRTPTLFTAPQRLFSATR